MDLSTDKPSSVSFVIKETYCVRWRSMLRQKLRHILRHMWLAHGPHESSHVSFSGKRTYYVVGCLASLFLLFCLIVSKRETSNRNRDTRCEKLLCVTKYDSRQTLMWWIVKPDRERYRSSSSKNSRRSSSSSSSSGSCNRRSNSRVIKCVRLLYLVTL